MAFYLKLITNIIISIILSPIILGYKFTHAKNVNLIIPDRWQLQKNNPFFMLKYLIENDKAKNTYICVKKNKLNKAFAENEKIVDHILWYSSIKYFFVSSIVNNYYYSHSFLQCHPTIYPTIFKGKNYFFISHGIELFTKISKNGLKYTLQTSKININTVKDIDTSEIDIDPKKRIDCPFFKNIYQKRNISYNGRGLVFLTWTKFPDYQTFLKSNYTKKVDYIIKNFDDVDIYFHPYMKEYGFRYLKETSNLRDISNRDIFDLICEYDYCIVDESSVSLDFISCGKKAYLLNLYNSDIEEHFSDVRKSYKKKPIEEIKVKLYNNDIDLGQFNIK